jgi:putative methionine-R-sulfoxide reductase with GAF domain
MLDVESDQLNAFGEEDRGFLERAAGLIAHCLH